MKMSRRKFIAGTAGAAALILFPHLTNGGNEQVEADYMIQGAKIFTSSDRIETADIYVGGDKIVGIHWHCNRDRPDIHAKEIIRAEGKFATPGLVNAHTHASMTLLRSYSDDKALMDWLQKDIWPVEAKMKREDIYWGAALAAVEMIRGGTTAFADMYGPCMEEVAKVVDESGLRGSLSRGLISFADGDNKLAENVELYKNFHGTANGRITVMLGPHAIYTCPPDYLRKVSKAAEKIGAEIHMHMNETQVEIEDCVKNYGKRPFEVVKDTGLLEHGMLAAHCVWLSDEEIDIIRYNNVRVAHNPGSNMKLASGICPATKLLEKYITVALGTDGASSNNNLDMLEEIRLAALLAKVDTLNPLAIPAAQALNMGTYFGARALGLKDVGKLDEDYKADIVLWDMSGVEWQPNYNPASLLVYSANSAAADTVIVDGKILMQNRELKTLDEDKIRAEFTACANRLTGN